jgi:hypothetical protein
MKCVERVGARLATRDTSHGILAVWSESVTAFVRPSALTSPRRPVVCVRALDALQRSTLERCRVTRDRRLASSLDLRHPTIERRDELQQFAYSAASCHRHRYAPCRSVTVRDAFQISPHFVHRQ